MSRKARACAFTLVEALVALSLTAMAGAVVLLAVETTMDTANDGAESAIAEGMAEQLIDEVLGKRYKAAGVTPFQYPLGPNRWERSGTGRERFDDTDDFHQFVADGAEDIWGQPLGEGDDEGGLRHPAFRAPAGYFRDWQQRIDVYYVDDNDLSVRLPPYQTSSFRAVEVTISRIAQDGTVRVLTNRRRVYAYVPTL